MIGMALAEEISDLNQADKIGLSVILLLLFTATAVVLIDSPEKRTSSDTEPDQFNRNDLMFMNMMIVHHEQAIEMSELAENRTSNERILSLAENISQAQREENRQMSEWMKELGYESGNHHPMAGMATEQEMRSLQNRNGTEFNQLFAELMIEHHQGGIAMAENFRETGRHPELKEMQTQMIETQKREVEKMQSWQEQNLL
jgi:uncharacterized protein (DUF305 family)